MTLEEAVERALAQLSPDERESVLMRCVVDQEAFELDARGMLIAAPPGSRCVICDGDDEPPDGACPVIDLKRERRSRGRSRP